MHTKHDLISIFVSVGLFAILEVTSILMIANNSIVQKIELFDEIRDVQAYFWEKGQMLGHYFNYKKVNEDLFRENLQLRNELEAYRERELGSKLTSYSDSTGYRYVGARIVKNTVNTQHNYIIIDKGEDDGVKSGMGVVTSNGVIGVISSSGRHYSYVISFLNISQNISVKLLSSGTFGPMSWDGRSTKDATIREIPTHINIVERDTVVTSGYSTIYPPQIPLGIVESVNSTDGLSQNVHVHLFEEFQALDYVYVVYNEDAEEIKELEKNGI